MNQFDWITLIIVLTLVTLIIILNFNYTLDKKMTDISVNIPPIPDPSITVKIQRSCGQDKYDVYVEKSGKSLSISPVTMNINNNVDKNEHFGNSTTITTNTNSNFEQTMTPIQLTSVESETNIKKTNEKSVKYPELENIPESVLREKCKLMTSSENNNSIININNNSMDNDIYDINKFYKKHQQVQKRYLEDPWLRGSNINDYDEFGSIMDIGTLKITNDVVYPKPMGYVFENSPAYIV